jgi:hypothetical protein
MPPSRRITSPLSISFPTMCSTRAAYSSGRPRRCGKGVCWLSDSLMLSVSPAAIGVSKIPGGYGHHPYAVRRELSSERQRHRNDGTFGGGVGGLSYLAVERCDRRSVDNYPALSTISRFVLGHYGGSKPYWVECPHEIDLDHFVEVFQRVRTLSAEYSFRRADACTVDETAKTTEDITDGFQSALNALFVGHVGAHEARLLPDLARNPLPGLVVNIRDQDIPAGFSKQTGSRGPQARATAGDEKGISVYLQRSILP